MSAALQLTRARRRVAVFDSGLRRKRLAARLQQGRIAVIATSPLSLLARTGGNVALAGGDGALAGNAVHASLDFFA